MTARITDHVGDSIARLATQFRTTQIEGLLTDWLTPAQELENALYALLVERQIGTAVGTNLEIIGAWVGESRNGVTDDDEYRRYIRARIATNRSSGLISDLIKISHLVISDTAAIITAERQGIASVRVRVDAVAVSATIADILISFLRDAKAAGVRLILESATGLPGVMFTLAVGGGLGFGKAQRLDLAPFTTNVDTVIRLRATGGTAGYDTLTLVHDAGAPAGGLLTQVANPPYGVDYTFTFLGGTTTVAQFETAINASDDLHVYTIDGVGTMADTVDEVVGAGFGIGGSNGPVTGGIFAGARI